MLSYNDFITLCTSIAPTLVPEMRPMLLVVDDSYAIRQLLCTALRHAYHVEPATCVREALDVLRTRRVDLVLTDLLMSDDNGLSLFDHVSERYPHIPVVFMSGLTEKDLRDGARARTPHVVAKPFQLDELEATLRAATAGAPLPR